MIVAYTIVAVFWGAVGFVGGAGGRQGSFLGEHDLAAVGTMALAVGLARIHSRTGRPGLFAIVAIVAGGLGITLGASLASLLGLYLAVAAVLGLALARHRLRLGAVLATLGVAVVVTAGTLSLRSGEFGFIQEWFGPEPERPGQYAASWSQRLIYAYVGGRVFLDRPLLGTGWYGELPPGGVRALPAGRTRALLRPAAALLPQQQRNVHPAADLRPGAVRARPRRRGRCSSPPRCWPCGRRLGPDFAGPVSGEWAELAYVPAAWLAGLAGALAGAALFGGAPLTAMFWLTLGVAAAAPALVPASSA